MDTRCWDYASSESLLVLEFSERKPQIKQEPVVKNKIDVITLTHLVADRVSTDA